MFTVDILGPPSKRTMGFSGSLQSRSKVFATVLYIAFTKWALNVLPFSERNIRTTLTLIPLCLVYPLAQL